MNRLFLKEYGSWSVMVISYLTGLFIHRGSFDVTAISVFLALALFINSKQAFTLWYRQKERMYLWGFVAQSLVASMVLLLIFGESILRLLPFCSVPLLYMVFFVYRGEHSLLTELLGFATLSLAALLGAFVATVEVDYRLYIATFTFFAAGVFKVRVQLRKGLKERVGMLIYAVVAILVYNIIGVSLFILLPIIDNAVHAITLYKTRLKVTGWIELSKSVLFMLLVLYLYR